MKNKNPTILVVEDNLDDQFMMKRAFKKIGVDTPIHMVGDGFEATVGGVVICRQRPGTAKGHVFISVEDETGIANAIVRSELFEKLRLTITHESYLEIAGTLQHLEGVVSVLAKDVRALDVKHRVATQSYEFR